MSAIVLQFLQFPAPLFAQQAPNDGVEAWRTLDTDFRQAIIDEILAKRGLTGNVDNADALIRSAEDIREALRVSCDLSGACADASARSTLGEQLIALPDYDEQQGLLNAQIILNQKKGHGK